MSSIIGGMAKGSEFEYVLMSYCSEGEVWPLALVALNTDPSNRIACEIEVNATSVKLVHQHSQATVANILEAIREQCVDDPEGLMESLKQCDVGALVAYDTGVCSLAELIRLREMTERGLFIWPTVTSIKASA